MRFPKLKVAERIGFLEGMVWYCDILLKLPSLDIVSSSKLPMYQTPSIVALIYPLPSLFPLKNSSPQPRYLFPPSFSLISNFPNHNFPTPDPKIYKFAAPSTIPTILYRFEKNVYQSCNTPFSFSLRSSYSARTSSGFVLVNARALEASWPANTIFVVVSLKLGIDVWHGKKLYHDKNHLEDMLCCLLRRRLVPIAV